LDSTSLSCGVARGYLRLCMDSTSRTDEGCLYVADKPHLCRNLLYLRPWRCVTMSPSSNVIGQESLKNSQWADFSTFSSMTERLGHDLIVESIRAIKTTPKCNGSKNERKGNCPTIVGFGRKFQKRMLSSSHYAPTNPSFSQYISST